MYVCMYVYVDMNAYTQIRKYFYKYIYREREIDIDVDVPFSLHVYIYICTPIHTDIISRKLTGIEFHGYCAARIMRSPKERCQSLFRLLTQAQEGIS